MCPENPLGNGISFLTEWFVLVSKNYDVFNIKLAKPSQTTFYYRMASTTPFFFHRMEAYIGVNPTHSVQEMAREICTQQFLHTKVFAHKTFPHKRFANGQFCTRNLLNTKTVTRGNSCTQKL